RTFSCLATTDGSAAAAARAGGTWSASAGDRGPLQRDRARAPIHAEGAIRAGVCRRRSAAAGAGARQPVEQRGQVLAAWRLDRGSAVSRGRGRYADGDRSRDRLAGGSRGEHLRTVRARVQRNRTANSRSGHGTGDQSTTCRGARWADLGRQRWRWAGHQLGPVAARGQSRSGGVKRVLLVEDDQGLRELIAEALLDDGYRVDSAPDGAVALELAAQDPPDLVILDLMMPNVDGEAF